MPKMEKTKHSGIYKVRLGSGDVRYRAYINTGKDEHGKHKQRVLTARTLAAAKAKKAEVASEVAKGSYITQRRELTVDAYLDQWFAAKARSVKPATVAAYEHHAKPLRAALGTKALPKVTKADLERLVTGLLKSSAHRPNGASPKTVNDAITLYRQVFKDATEEGLLSRSSTLSSTGTH